MPPAPWACRRRRRLLILVLPRRLVVADHGAARAAAPRRLAGHGSERGAGRMGDAGGRRGRDVVGGQGQQLQLQNLEYAKMVNQSFYSDVELQHQDVEYT